MPFRQGPASVLSRVQAMIFRKTSIGCFRPDAVTSMPASRVRPAPDTSAAKISLIPPFYRWEAQRTRMPSRLRDARLSAAQPSGRSSCEPIGIQTSSLRPRLPVGGYVDDACPRRHRRAGQRNRLVYQVFSRGTKICWTRKMLDDAEAGNHNHSHLLEMLHCGFEINPYDSQVPGNDSRIPGNDSRIPGNDSRFPGFPGIIRIF